MVTYLTEKEHRLLNLLSVIPPDFEAAKVLIEKEAFTSDEITRTAIAYVQGCYFEIVDLAHDQHIPQPREIVKNTRSAFVCDWINFLLPYGLNPNGIYEDNNIMYDLHFIDNEFLAADALTILLEHGGCYDLPLPEETLFEHIDFDIWFGSIEMGNRITFSQTVHFWMVLIGYGARCQEDAMQVFRGFSWDKLKNHRNYYFGLSVWGKKRVISIYDKETLWEVARIGL